jgi:hypothetical protein
MFCLVSCDNFASDSDASVASSLSAALLARLASHCSVSESTPGVVGLPLLLAATAATVMLVARGWKEERVRVEVESVVVKVVFSPLLSSLATQK